MQTVAHPAAFLIRLRNYAAKNLDIRTLRDETGTLVGGFREVLGHCGEVCWFRNLFRGFVWDASRVLVVVVL